MKKLTLLAATALLGALIPSTSQAALLVEQWMGAGTGGLAGVDAAISGGPAQYSGLYDVIDFTDDPAGFAGLIPGSMYWPAAGGINLGTGAGVNSNFAARVSGMLFISAADTYTFRTYADDGVRLKIGGTTVITDNSYHPEIPLFGSIFLAPGAYALDLVFFEGFGEASLEFAVQQGDGPFGHVGAIGGPTTTGVPDAGATVSLLGVALLGLGAIRRKLS